MWVKISVVLALLFVFCLQNVDLDKVLNNDNVDLNDQEDNKSFHDERVQKLLKQGMSFGEMWLSFGQKKYPYDKNILNFTEF